VGGNWLDPDDVAYTGGVGVTRAAEWKRGIAVGLTLVRAVVRSQQRYSRAAERLPGVTYEHDWLGPGVTPPQIGAARGQSHRWCVYLVWVVEGDRMEGGV